MVKGYQAALATVPYSLMVTVERGRFLPPTAHNKLVAVRAVGVSAGSKSPKFTTQKPHAMRGTTGSDGRRGPAQKLFIDGRGGSPRWAEGFRLAASRHDFFDSIGDTTLHFKVRSLRFTVRDLGTNGNGSYGTGGDICDIDIVEQNIEAGTVIADAPAAAAQVLDGKKETGWGGKSFLVDRGALALSRWK
jgi:hypothetical protein